MPPCPVMLAAVTRRTALRLDRFLPFRLNRLSAEVSERLAAVYRGPAGLEVAEWRVLVTVAEHPGCAAQDVVLSTRMHKTRVSRAVAALLARRLLRRAPSPEDARAARLALTAAGERLYEELVPLALAQERELLAGLEPAGRRAFEHALGRLEESLGLRPERGPRRAARGGLPAGDQGSR